MRQERMVDAWQKKKASVSQLRTSRRNPAYRSSIGLDPLHSPNPITLTINPNYTLQVFEMEDYTINILTVYYPILQLSLHTITPSNKNIIGMNLSIK